MRRLIVFLFVILFSNSFGQHFSVKEEKVGFFEYDEGLSEEENTQRFFEYVTIFYVDDAVQYGDLSRSQPNPGDPTPIDQGSTLLTVLAFLIAATFLYRHRLKKDQKTTSIFKD